MKRTILTAITFTIVLNFFIPIAQAGSSGFRFSNGQPDATYHPFGRSSEAVDSRTLSDDIGL